MPDKLRAAVLSICVLAAGVGGGFLLGRFAAPSRVVEVASKKQSDEIRALMAQLETAKRHTVKRTVVTYSPTGKPATKTTDEDTHADRTTDTRTDVHAVKTVEVVKRVEITKPGPQWFVGPVGVFAPGAPAGQQFSAGLLVGRHLFGPLSAAVSVTVPVHQPISPPAIGLSITVGF